MTHRYVRYAAMIALMHHPIGGWFEKAVTGRGPQSRLRALVAADLRRESPPAARVAAVVQDLMRDIPRGSNRENRLYLLRILGRSADRCAGRRGRCRWQDGAPVRR